MKKRFLAWLLAVCIAASLLVLPASAVSSNTSVQTAAALGALTAEQAADPSAALTRGQFARLLVSFSAERESVGTQNASGTLFTDVNSSTPLAPYIRIAVRQGWLSGYTDGSFRPDNGVTLEEACTALLRLLGYDVTTLNGTFPAAQLNKASALGLRNDLNRQQGESLTLADGAQLCCNALTAQTAEGKTYGTDLGFTVSNGQVDVSSVLLSGIKGPFVAQGGDALPFSPSAVYRNDAVSSSAELSAYDV